MAHRPALFLTLLLPAGLALSACGERKPLLLNESESQRLGLPPDPATVMNERWHKLFANPTTVINAANDFGFHVTGYAASGGTPAYRGAGIEQTLPGSASPLTITTRFEATGASPDHVDAIRFDFDTRDESKGDLSKFKDARKIPIKIMLGFLQRFGVSPSDDVLDGIAQGKPAKTDHYGVTVSVTPRTTPTTSDALYRYVTVTILDDGASPPTQPQIKP